MIIYLASDHAGFELKEKIKEFLVQNRYEVKDMGPVTFDPADDYPDFIKPAAAAVAEDPENSRAIIMGASGQGEAMVANRLKGIRAAVFYGGLDEIIKLSREHNDANVLGISGDFLSDVKAKQVIKTWLFTEYPQEQRHQRRINQISDYEFSQGGGCCGGNGGCSC